MVLANAFLSYRSSGARSQQRWEIDRNSILGDSFFSGEFYSSYENFKACFSQWLFELATNKIAFTPFKDSKELKGDALEIVLGVKPDYSFWRDKRKKGFELMDVKLCNNLGDVQQNLSAAQTFMELFYITTLELCTNNLKMN